jgi:hypothetical protein
METPIFVVVLNWVLTLALIIVIASTAWDVTRLLRAERRIVQVLAERDEFRPLLRILLLRARAHGGELPITEHEEIDLREHVRRALAYVEPGDRKRVESGLLGRTVSGRQAYLRRVLYASMQRMQHQS